VTAGITQEPATVGPYRLVRKLGEGGMGVVHLALDPVGRAVAIKVLRAHVANDAEARRRLTREVATLRRVRHPRVAEVLDADVVGAEPYLVTRFVPGRSLEEEVRATGPMPAAQVARTGRALAEAIAAIHAAGIVHRDVKPANVMLVDGDPVLIDFGIAHVADESRITRTGLVMGTPGYLSPELIYGEKVTAATDWWAWGATLAFASTGRQPFGSGPIEVVLERVRRGDCDLDGVQPQLRDLLAATLTVDASRRPWAGDLMAAMDAVIAGVTTAPMNGGSAAANGAAAHPGPTVRQVLDPTTRMPPSGQPPVGGGPAGQPAAVAHAAAGQPPSPYPPYPGAVSGQPARIPPYPGRPSGAAQQSAPPPYPPQHQPAQSYPPKHQPPQSYPPQPHPPQPHPPQSYRGPSPPQSYAGPSQPPQPYPAAPHRPHQYPAVYPYAGGPQSQQAHPAVETYPPPAQAYPPSPGQIPSTSPYSTPQPQRQPQPPGSAAPYVPGSAGQLPDQRRVTGMLAALVAMNAAVAAVAPGGAMVLFFLFSVLARTVQRSSIGLQRRRQELGPSRADMAVTVAKLPWRLLMATLISLLAGIVPTLVAGSTAFIVGSVVTRSGSPWPSGPVALGLGAVAGCFTGWWGPGGWALRGGARAVVRGTTGSRAAKIGVLALLVLLALASVIVASKAGHTADWSPFQAPFAQLRRWSR